MKILQVTRQFSPAVGGIEAVVLNLSQALIQRGREVGVVTLNRTFDAPRRLKAEEVVEGIPVQRIPYVGSPRYAIAPSVIAKIGEADLVDLHSSDFFLDYLAFTQVFHHKPLVLHSHGLYFHSAFAGGVKKVYLQTVTRLALRRVSAVICDSQHDIALLKQVAPEEKLRLIPNGVNDRFLRQVGNAREPGLMISVGRLSGNKRCHLLLKAFTRVAMVIPTARLILIGKDQGELDSLRRLADELGISDRVHFMGEVPFETLTEYLSRAPVWLSASEYESFGIAALEAMASGCVPVVQRLSAFEDFIHDQENGFFTDFSDDNLAASAILRVFNMGDAERNAISRRAKETASCFTWESVAAQVDQVYENVLSRA